MKERSKEFLNKLADLMDEYSVHIDLTSYHCHPIKIEFEFMRFAGDATAQIDKIETEGAWISPYSLRELVMEAE